MFSFAPFARLKLFRIHSGQALWLNRFSAFVAAYVLAYFALTMLYATTGRLMPLS
jgi:hypothetical protein